MFKSLGFSTPYTTAFLVISLKTTLSTFLPFKRFLSSSMCLTCQAMASPSLSGSVARIIFSQSSAASAISLICFLEAVSISQTILKLFSVSTDPFFDGRSLT